MKNVLRGSIIAAVVALAVQPALAVFASANTLDIYFIDVEGGQSTLIVTPAGQSLLVDTGFAGFENRDPLRILAAVREAGLKQIDFLLVTHFHWDHDGGVPELARRVPIRTFVDHGDLERTPEARAGSAWEVTLDRYNSYRAVRGNNPHLEPKPGDRLPLQGVDVTFVSSAGATIGEPLPGAGRRTPGCTPTAPTADDPFENPRSTGFVMRFGRFRFLDLGDLSGAPLFSLLCPKSLSVPWTSIWFHTTAAAMQRIRRRSPGCDRVSPSSTMAPSKVERPRRSTTCGAHRAWKVRGSCTRPPSRGW